MPISARGWIRLAPTSLLVATGFFALLHWSSPTASARAAGRRASAAADTESLPRYQSRWFMISSDAPAQRAAQIAAPLDALADRFMATMTSLGAPVRTPKARLSIVYFADRKGFVACAREQDGVDASWMGGYYSGKHNHVVAYDDATGEEFAAALARCDSSAAGQSKRDAVLAQAADATREKLAHEAVHLLAFNTGLQAQGRRLPAWLTEGLAESFARGALSDHADASPGPGRLRSAQTMSGDYPDSSAPPDAVDAFYADSQSLVDAIVRRSPHDLVALFRDLNAAPSDAIAATIAARAAGRVAPSLVGTATAGALADER